jgi:hypothetical protein
MTERLAKVFAEKADFEKNFEEDEFARFIKNCKQLQFLKMNGIHSEIAG